MVGDPSYKKSNQGRTSFFFFFGRRNQGRT